ARAVRDEDSFNVTAVHDWLTERVPGLTGPAEVKQFPGGASNLTYLLRYPERDLILRRPPRGTKARSAHDMRREHTIQSRLKPVFRYVPEMLALCTDESVIGSDFYVMERLDGIILRRDLPPGLTLSPAAARQLCHTVIDRLVELHSIDPAAAGLDEIGKGHGYVRRQVTGWSDRYRKARTWNVPTFGSVMTWLHANQPDDVRTCVIHNDFRFDNVVLSPEASRHGLSVVGILDWEMATLGDPLMDLGGSLAYWTQADDGRGAAFLRRQPTHLPGMLTRREVVDYYCAKTGITPENWTFYEVFGLFRLAAIAQQIYYRYFHRQTHNPAFKHIWIGVHQLHRKARQLVKAT
ncbi:MAG: phosphotransferase family protein, partial [Micromonosporaceae bacterium]